MKPLTVLLLNVVTVAVALVAYDALRAPPEPADPAPTVDLSALEERIEALESAHRASRRVAGTDPSVYTRLAALEAALEIPAAVDAVPDLAAVDDDAAATVAERPPPRRGDGGEVTEADVQRFRALREAVRREERIEKNRMRIDGALDKLPLNLTAKQREAVHREFAAFQPRVDEIWTEVKARAQETVANGGTVDRGEIVSSTTTVIQGEFAETLIGVVGAADAQTIAAALHPGR